MGWVGLDDPIGLSSHNNSMILPFPSLAWALWQLGSLLEMVGLFCSIIRELQGRGVRVTSAFLLRLFVSVCPSLLTLVPQ